MEWYWMSEWPPQSQQHPHHVQDVTEKRMIGGQGFEMVGLLHNVKDYHLWSLTLTLFDFSCKLRGRNPAGFSLQIKINMMISQPFNHALGEKQDKHFMLFWFNNNRPTKQRSDDASKQILKTLSKRENPSLLFGERFRSWDDPYWIWSHHHHHQPNNMRAWSKQKSD